MKRFLPYATAVVDDVIELIRVLVECQSPSDSPGDVNRLVDLLIEHTSDIATATRIPAGGYGDHLLLDFGGSGEAGRILCLGHSDTVWPLGSLKTMPFRREAGRLWGPGVLDMKAGLAFLIFAVRVLRRAGEVPKKQISLLVVSDEEIGSPSSRALTEAEASKSDCVLVLEPGTGFEGKLKTSRKGIGRYVLRVRGRAAHAGVDFENGANAIVELAAHIQTVAGWTDLAQGLTVNAGVLSGGTRSNVVPAEAQVEFDLRVRSGEQAAEFEGRIHSLQPLDARCELSVSGGMNRPPMERTPAVEGLFLKAQACAAEAGIDLQESATGGGSDGNFTAALGIPTLDGLGAVGEGAHAANESILPDRIPDRIALLSSLLIEL